MDFWEGFAKQADCGGIGDSLIQIEARELLEGQTVASLILGLIIRQVNEGL